LDKKGVKYEYVGGVNTLLRLKMRVNGALDLNISVNLAVVAVYYMVD